MDCSNSHNGYPAQPPKKRKSDFDERDLKPDFNQLNSRVGATTPPESGDSQSQDSPLDFSVKNGSDSITPPSVISPPSTISPPSARTSPSSAISPPLASSPMSNHFPSPDLEMVRKNMTNRMSLNESNYSDSGPRHVPENINATRPKISIVSPTVHMHTEEDTPCSKENGAAVSNFAEFIPTSHNPYDVNSHIHMNGGNFENGFGNQPKEFGQRTKGYETAVNGFSHPMPNEGLCSTKMAGFNPYLAMLPASFGNGIMNGQAGILASQSGLLNSQGGLLGSQGALLSGQGGILGSQSGLLSSPGGLLNGQNALINGYTNGDRKVSKSARPFKIYEHEILNYPYQNCTPLIPSRFPEIPQQATAAFSHADSTRNESSSQQQPSPNPRQSKGTTEPQQVSDEFSDESQHSNNAAGYDSSSTRRKGQKYPDEKKDAAYYEKRRKNNLAAKRSRDARRLKEDAIATRARNLVQENTMLRMQLHECHTINMRLEAELNGFKRAAYDQRSEIDKLKDEVERLNRGFAYTNASRNCDRSESPSL